MTWFGWGSTKSADSQEETDGAVLKESRQKCYQARDAFYKCCEDKGAPFSNDAPPPAACKKARKLYEASCKASWVKHFDRLKDKEVRVISVLHKNINERATINKGNLAGETFSK